MLVPPVPGLNILLDCQNEDPTTDMDGCSAGAVCDAECECDDATFQVSPGRRRRRKYKKFAPTMTAVDELYDNGMNILLANACEAESMLGNLQQTRPGHRLVEGVFDTGAVHSCTPPGIFAGEVRPSKMSRAGKKYRGPDNSPIPNLGQLDVRFTTDEGVQTGLTFQVANIERPLIAGTHVTAAGNEVTLRETEGVITNIKSGRQIKLHKRGGDDGGVYVFRMWVPDVEGTTQPFPRPGA